MRPLKPTLPSTVRSLPSQTRQCTEPLFPNALPSSSNSSNTSALADGTVHPAMSRRPFPPPDVPYHRSSNEWGRRGPAEYRPFRHPEEYEAYLASERERQWNAGQNQNVGGGGGPSQSLSHTQNDPWERERERELDEGRNWKRGPDLYRPGAREEPYRPRGYDRYRPDDEPAPSRFQNIDTRPPSNWAPSHSHTRIPPSPPPRSQAPHRREFHAQPRSSQSSAGPSRDISREGSAEPSTQRRGGASSAPIPEHLGSPQPPFRRASRSPSPFIPTLPPAEYIALSRKQSPPAGGGSGSREESGAEPLPRGPKILVLDLNGALVYRNRQTGVKRKSYPRPYLSCFLEYLFLPEPTTPGETSAPPRPYEVFVWSSAQPHNVRAMVESTFGSRWIEGVWEKEGDEVKEQRLQRGEGRLTGVWARDRMGLNAHEYGNKVQTFKDLRKVAEHFQPTNLNPNSESESEPVDGPSTYSFDESNIILLDDSPLKAIFQPWNQIVIPEYERTAFQSSRDVALRLQAKPEAALDGLDEILLAVIGILEDLRGVDNVPAWVRAGGLTPPSPKIDASTEEPASASAAVGAEPTLESLPSHETFDHWFADPNVLRHWIGRGKEALARKGIKLDIGLDTSDVSPGPNQLFRQALPLSSEGTPQLSGEDLDELGEISGRRRRQSPRYSPTASASRYSPSAPVHATAGQEDPVDSSEWLLPPLTKPASQASELHPKRQPQPIPQLQSDPKPKSDRPGPVLVDSWRTFRALDVSLYLQDAASRLCPPDDNSRLTSQQRESLLGAAKALRELAPDPMLGPSGGQQSMAGPSRSGLAAMGTRMYERPNDERTLSTGQRVANERNGEARRNGSLGSDVNVKLGRQAARLEKKERRKEAKRDLMAKGMATATAPAQRTRGSGQAQAQVQAQAQTQRRPSGSGDPNETAAPKSGKRPRGKSDDTADTGVVPKKKKKGKAAATAMATAMAISNGGTGILEPAPNIDHGRPGLHDASPVPPVPSSDSQVNHDYMSEFVEMLLPPPPPPPAPSARPITRTSHPSLPARPSTTTTAPPTHAAAAAAAASGPPVPSVPAPGQKTKNSKLHINEIHARYLAGGGTMSLNAFHKAYQRITSWDGETRRLENTIAEGSRRLREAGSGSGSGSGSGGGGGEELKEMRKMVLNAEGKRDNLRSKLEELRKKVGGTLALPLPQ